jgi:Holliday junction DNA helicase RuvA
MIGRLKGIVDEYGDDFVILDVQGVGYHVACSTKTLASLPSVGEAATLQTEMLVSENSIRLVGFTTEAERGWFRLLDNVQGVGTKVALALLSTLTTAELTNAIALGDKAMVGRANGVGPKLAQRIVTELKDKAPAFTGGDSALAAVAGALDSPRPTAAAEAVSALVNLGYGQSQAGAAVSAAMRAAGEDAATETLIRLGLKELAR